MHSGRRAAHAGKVAQIVLVGLVVTGLSAQVSEIQRGIGIPEDWTHHHIRFSVAALRKNPQLASREPRAAMQLYRQLRTSLAPSTASPEFVASPFGTPHRDWSVTLGTGRIPIGQFPAKWNSNPALPITAANCDTDFIIYPLNVAGVTGGQAGMVAFNNLYSGATGTPLCPGAQPKFLFSYNTSTVAGGKIQTSPTLSQDGTKVAFIETTTAAPRTTIFHVLNIPASNPGPTFPEGNSATAAVAVPVNAMSSLTVVANSDTRSSPWVDYASDTAYVAADDGRLYKINGVFNSTPTLAGAPWPILIRNNSTLTSPVLDVTGNIFIGAGNGTLFSVNVNTPGPVSSIAVGTSGGPLNPTIYDAPLLDSSGGSVFAISSNDGTSAVVVQASISSLTQIARVNVGAGSTSGTAVNLYDGDFDNNFTTPLTGHMLVCGTGAADSTPWRYLLGFDASGVLQPDLAPVQLSTATNARCGPVTEFFNTNTNGGTDYFFWGVSRSCPTTTPNGCVMSLVNGAVGPVSAQQVGGTSGIIVDNNSTQGQASSIYFSTEGAPLSAVKLTQQGLN